MAYSYKKTITIQNAEIKGSGSHADYVFMFNSTDNDLKRTDFGGLVEDNEGDDIIISSTDALDGSGIMDFERTEFQASSGTFVAWVRIPSLPTGSDYTLYLLFGDPSVTTYQGNDTGVWNSKYLGAYHFDETPVGTSFAVSDSTSNAHNGTTTSTTAGWPQAVSGASPTENGLYFNGGHGTYLDLGGGAANHVYNLGVQTPTFTVQLMTNCLANFQDATLWSRHIAADEQLRYHTQFGDHRLVWWDVVPTAFAVRSGNNPQLNTWEIVHMVRDNVAGTWDVYMNGTQDFPGNSSISGNAPRSTTNNLTVGGFSDGTDLATDIYISEFRVLDTTFDIGQAETEYENYINTGSFYTLGATESGAGIAASRRFVIIS